MGNCCAKTSNDDSTKQARNVEPCHATSQKDREKSSLPSNGCNGPLSKNKKRKNLISNERRLNTRGMVLARTLHPFPYNVMKAATRHFNDRNLIGRGGFGDVYKGWINLDTMNAARPGHGCIVAIKKLRKESTEGHKEWQTELNFLNQVNHPNVVKLIGYCSQGKRRILVYEYMSRGCLETCLTKGLSWKRRMRIATGAAKGLAHLHTATHIIHRDIKSSNILIDSDYNPKLSDFGLSKNGPQGDKSHVTTGVLGTRGYFAPEYVNTGHLTFRTDIYSFGVVLLELISGSGAIKKDTEGLVIDLVSWAKPLLGGTPELMHVIDKRLWRKFRIEEASEFASIVLRCLDSDPKSRPTITEIVAALEPLENSRRDSTSRSPHQMSPVSKV